MKKIVLGIIIGIIISGTVVYASNYLYQADEVSYTPSNTNWEVSSVDEAIDELYNKINEVNSALLSLKNTAIAKAVGANGNTFSSVINKLGEITNQGNKSFTVSNTSSITIPAGYYNGTGKINVSGLVPAPTGTFTPSAHGTQIDMGANNTYRYINTTNVWNQAWNAGVAAADGRADSNTYNWQHGYNSGYNAASSNYRMAGFFNASNAGNDLYSSVIDTGNNSVKSFESFIGYDNNGNNTTTGTFSVEGSNDNSSWVAIVSRSDTRSPRTGSSLTLSGTTTYRFIRFHLTTGIYWSFSGKGGALVVRW